MNDESKRELCADGEYCPECMAYLEGEYGHRRTCRMKYDEWLSGDEYYPTEVYLCDQCGNAVLTGKPNYCPNCGARVISEEEEGHMMADAIRRLEKVLGE